MIREFTREQITALKDKVTSEKLMEVQAICKLYPPTPEDKRSDKYFESMSVIQIIHKIHLMSILRRL